MQVRPRHVAQPTWLWGQLKGLETSARLDDSAAVIARLRAIVPEFRPTTPPWTFPVDEGALIRRPSDVTVGRFGAERERD
jgi:hypothetical protein